MSASSPEEQIPWYCWICEDPALLAAATAATRPDADWETQHPPLPTSFDASMSDMRLVRASDAAVMLGLLRPDSDTPALSLRTDKSCLWTTDLLGDNSDGYLDVPRTAGLIVSIPDINCIEPGDGPSILRAAQVLRAEVGEDGEWLAPNSRIYYRESDGLPPVPSRPQTPTHSLLRISGMHYQSDQSVHAAVANVVTFCVELIKLASLYNLARIITNMEGTEAVVLPPAYPEIPPFQPYHFFRDRVLDGRGVLFVIPTANKFKVQTLREAALAAAPKGSHIDFLPVPTESGVGEQPYNEAGVMGAYNRINNALQALQGEQYRSVMVNNAASTVIVASIESYIQTNNVDRPTDFGAIVIHNATTGRTTSGLSVGTTVDPVYVDRARRFGFEHSNPNHGRVTVGQILAAHIEGLDKANWHEVLARRSRYDMLKTAVDAMEFPW